MGRQVNFYLGPADQAAFEAIIASAGAYLVLADRAASPNPEILKDTLIRAMGEERLRVLLARPADLAAMRFSYSAGQSAYFGNSTALPVVEFDRCFVSDQTLRRGRLYFQAEQFSGSPDFVAWADHLLKSVRRKLKRTETSGTYAGADALRLREAGLRFDRL